MGDTTRLSESDRAELVAYLDGELDASAAKRFEARLRAEPVLRAEADAYRQTWALLDELPQPATSGTLASRTLQQIAVEPPAAPPNRWFSRAGLWAALALVAAVAGYLLVPNPRVEYVLETDPVYKADPRMIENLPYYLAVENFEYLQSLDSSELFGDDAVGR